MGLVRANATVVVAVTMGGGSDVAEWVGTAARRVIGTGAHVNLHAPVTDRGLA